MQFSGGKKNEWTEFERAKIWIKRELGATFGTRRARRMSVFNYIETLYNSKELIRIWNTKRLMKLNEPTLQL